MNVWCLFDGSGLAGMPWADAGHDVYCVNADGADHGAYSFRVSHDRIHYVNHWIEAGDTLGFLPVPSIILAFPPCTDLAVSGAAHFERKREENPQFQIDATELCRVAERIAEMHGCPYMIENPVSVLSTMWRKPDHSFHPFEFGGYLPDDDQHPWFPEYIAGRDAYPKKTCLWVGGGFDMPNKRAVDVEPGYSAQHKKLGGKSAKTKAIRSLTPRGFALAVFEANKGLV